MINSKMICKIMGSLFFIEAEERNAVKSVSL